MDDHDTFCRSCRRTFVRWLLSTAAATRHPISTTFIAASSTAIIALKKLLEIKAPDVIVRNEKRMLAGGRRCAHRQLRSLRHAAAFGSAPPAPFARRHVERQAGPFPPEPARQARRLFRPFSYRRRSEASRSTRWAFRSAWRSSFSVRSSISEIIKQGLAHNIRSAVAVHGRTHAGGARHS